MEPAAIKRQCFLARDTRSFDKYNVFCLFPTGFIRKVYLTQNPLPVWGGKVTKLLAEWKKRFNIFSKRKYKEN